MAEKGSWIGLASIVIAAVPIFVGIYEYKVNNQRDFEKNFLTQQSQVYDELLGDLGGISASICSPDSVSQANYNKAKYNFNELYYGKLNLYQTPQIEGLTDSLYNMVNDYDSIRAIDSHKVVLENLIDSIQQKVYNLSVKCKQSLKDTYNL